MPLDYSRIHDANKSDQVREGGWGGDRERGTGTVLGSYSSRSPTKSDVCFLQACAQDQSQKFLSVFRMGQRESVGAGDLLYWCLVGLGLHTELVLTE